MPAPHEFCLSLHVDVDLRLVPDHSDGTSGDHFDVRDRLELAVIDLPGGDTAQVLFLGQDPAVRVDQLEVCRVQGLCDRHVRANQRSQAFALDRPDLLCLVRLWASLHGQLIFHDHHHLAPLIACGGSAVNGPGQGNSFPLTVSSPDLAGGTFLREFTCDGANRRPRLQWSAPPSGTQELAVEMLDPDAPGGTFTHWLVYGLPPGLSSLVAVPAGAAEGVNDFGRRGYGGPCPPRGPAHHYHFVVLCAGHPAELGSRGDEV